MLNSYLLLLKDFDTRIPDIELDKFAFIAPTVVLVSAKALIILFLNKIVSKAKIGTKKKTTQVNIAFKFTKYIKEPITKTPEINTSSGPWWASSEISTKSFIILDIISPVWFLSK